jgi:hypothetical protein
LKSGAELPAIGQCFLAVSGYATRQTSTRQRSQSRERPHPDSWKPIAQPHEHCARAATRLRCQCRAAKSSQTGSVFHGRLGGAFKFRQAPNQLRE